MASASNHGVELDGWRRTFDHIPRCGRRARSSWSAEVLGVGSWVHGPGDDGAVVPTAPAQRA